MDDRRDDWHRGVDENLAALNAGQRVWGRDLAAMRKTLEEIDRLLRGDPDRDTDGAIARLHHQENEVNLLKAIILKDVAGGKGLVNRVETLEKAEKGAENRWKYATAVSVALLSLFGLVLTNWGPILAYLGYPAKPNKLERIIENAKHPKNRVHRYVIQEQPDQPEPEGD